MKRSINFSEMNTDLTFDNDGFSSLQQFGKQLISIVENSDYYKRSPLYDKEQNGFVLAIDSSWGTGKTTFLNRLHSELNKRPNFKAIYYNAWECDDFNNALIPIIYIIKTLLDQEEISNGPVSKLNTIINRMKASGFYFGKLLRNTPIALSISTPIGLGGGIDINPKEFWDTLKKIIDGQPRWMDKDIYEDFADYLEIKNEFINAIKACKTLESKKLVIIIDEMDRCKPTYAIETLEVVKHFFNINNINFILALDINQLSHSIANIYGPGIDSSGYLRRFFDLQINFPPVEINEFVRLQFGNIELDENIISNQLTESTQTSRIGNNHKLVDGIGAISKNLMLSLRDIEKFVSYLILIYRTSFKGRQIYGDEHLADIFSVYYYLISLILKYPRFWELITTNQRLCSVEIDQFLNNLEDQFIIPARYFYDNSINPFAVQTFCRNVLYPYKTLHGAINKLKDLNNSINSEYVNSLLLNQSNNNISVFESIMLNLSIIPLNLLKHD